MSAPVDTRNRGLEGVRAVAAFAVVGTHLGSATGYTYRNPAIGQYLVRLDIGVSIFFVLSGFLLYRPFLRHHLLGRDPVAFWPYLRRRVLRIVPAYWVALALVPLLLDAQKFSTVADVVIYGGFLQIYSQSRVLGGISQAWSLCTEMSYYLVLPFIAAGAVRLGRRWRPVHAEVAVLAALYVGAVGFRAVIALTDPSFADMSALWLPAKMDLFVLGMGLALVQVGSDADPMLDRIRQTVVRAGRWCYLVAAIGFWVIATRLDLPLGLGGTPPFGRAALLQAIAGIVGLGLVAPVALGASADPVGRSLASAPMVWLGTISYGLYVWHLDIIEASTRWTGGGLINASLFRVAAVGVPLSVVAAALSWYLVEKPTLRWRRPRFAPAPAEVTS